jgi:hypothetical protein
MSNMYESSILQSFVYLNNKTYFCERLTARFATAQQHVAQQRSVGGFFNSVKQNRLIIYILNRCLYLYFEVSTTSP